MATSKNNKHLEINSKTHVYGLLGASIGDSLSPEIHNHIFKTLGKNAVYLSFPTSPQLDVLPAPALLRDLGFKGVNVTQPLKLRFASIVKSQLPSVNTLKFDGSNILSTSTDGEGFFEALKFLKKDIFYFKKVIFLGFGGAAFSILQSLIDLNWKDGVIIFKRRPVPDERLSTMKKFFSHFAIEDFSFLALEKEKGSFWSKDTLVIQATNLEVSDQKVLPSIAIQLKKFPGLVCDLRYGRGNEFLNLLQDGGVEHISGMPMLIMQAIYSQKFWDESIDLEAKELFKHFSEELSWR